MYTFLSNVKISLTAFSSQLAAKIREIIVSCAILGEQLHLLNLRYIETEYWTVRCCAELYTFFHLITME